jgi:hypothetical protein
VFVVVVVVVYFVMDSVRKLLDTPPYTITQLSTSDNLMQCCIIDYNFASYWLCAYKVHDLGFLGRYFHAKFVLLSFVYKL